MNLLSAQFRFTGKCVRQLEVYKNEATDVLGGRTSDSKSAKDRVTLENRRGSQNTSGLRITSLAHLNTTQ